MHGYMYAIINAIKVATPVKMTTLITVIAQVLIESRAQGKEAVRRIHDCTRVHVCRRSLGGFKIPRTVIINEPVSFLPGSNG